MINRRLLRCGAAAALLLFSLPGGVKAQVAVFPEIAPLPVTVAASDPRVFLMGRFDLRDKEGPRCAWPGCGALVRFRGTAAAVAMEEQGGNQYTIMVDGTPTGVLTPAKGLHIYSLASGLKSGEHTAALYKRTEAFMGVTRIIGFQLEKGVKVLKAPVPKRRIELIGDSITCGYGNEAANEKVHFSAETENETVAYGFLAAADLKADFHCEAWSGRKMWPDNSMPEIYPLVLPFDKGSKWDASRWVPDVVVINLATNDFGGGYPNEDGWVGGYRAFIKTLRSTAPKAAIYCAIGPMLWDGGQPTNANLTTVRKYTQRIVAEEKAAGNADIRILKFPQQKYEDGLGADWHPSKKTHRRMADKLIDTLKADMHW